MYCLASFVSTASKILLIMTWQTTKISGNLFLIILVAILIAPVIYIYYLCPGTSFYESVMSNLIATGLALIVGIPVALWIDRRIKEQENLISIKNERQKEAKMLTLIKEELNFSLSSLFLKGKKGNKKTLITQPLKSDLWDAMSSSSDIQCIEEPDLLNRIVSAYYALKIVKSIEEQAYRAIRGITVTFTMPDGTVKNNAQFLLEDAREFDGLFESSMNEALSMIDKRLETLKKI